VTEIARDGTGINGSGMTGFIEYFVIALLADVDEKGVVGDAEKPRGKAGLTSEIAQTPVRLEEGVLREFIRERFVSAREPTQQNADG